MKLVPRRMPAECKAGVHRFGQAQQAGPSILRRICVHCSHVSIDLTAQDHVPELSLFTDRSGTTPAAK